MRQAFAAAAGLCALIAAPVGAFAHPHVFINAEMRLEIGADGVLRKIHHQWTFDDMYSAFAVQGLRRADGAPEASALAALARDLVGKLEDVDYFTEVRAPSHELQATGAEQARADFADGRLRLSFTVTLRALGPEADHVEVRVFDPQYVVAISLAESVPVSGPSQCRRSLAGPSPLAPADARKLDDSARTNQLDAGFGAKLATVVRVDCRTAP